MISVKEYTNHTIIIKKSEFICHLIPCSHIEQAKNLYQIIVMKLQHITVLPTSLVLMKELLMMANPQEQLVYLC